MLIWETICNKRVRLGNLIISNTFEFFKSKFERLKKMCFIKFCMSLLCYINSLMIKRRLR